MNDINIFVSEKNQKDFAPAEREDEKASMRNYKSVENQEIAKQRIEYAEVKPKDKLERTSTTTRNNNNAKLHEKSDTEC